MKEISTYHRFYCTLLSNKAFSSRERSVLWLSMTSSLWYFFLMMVPIQCYKLQISKYQILQPLLIQNVVTFSQTACFKRVCGICVFYQDALDSCIEFTEEFETFYFKCCLPSYECSYISGSHMTRILYLFPHSL